MALTQHKKCYISHQVGATPTKVTIIINSHVFKAGVCRPQAGAPGFLELLLSVNFSMCVCARPRGY